jgi:hypothetical protein
MGSRLARASRIRGAWLRLTTLFGELGEKLVEIRLRSLLSGREQAQGRRESWQAAGRQLARQATGGPGG